MGSLVWSDLFKHTMIIVLLIVTVIILVLLLSDIDTTIKSLRPGMR